MKKTEIIATRDSPYGGKRYKTGDTRKVTASEARVLVALGHAKAKPKEARAATYKRRDMVAESPQVSAPVTGTVTTPVARAHLDAIKGPETAYPSADYKTKAST